MRTLAVIAVAYWLLLSWEDEHDPFRGVAPDFSLYIYGGKIATAADTQTEEPFEPEQRDL